jgi:hypothetical protein
VPSEALDVSFIAASGSLPLSSSHEEVKADKNANEMIMEILCSLKLVNSNFDFMV